MDIILNNIKGKTQLWKVFWIQNILIGALLNVFIEIFGPNLGEVVLYIVVAFSIIYSLWVTIGMWQCAFNANWSGWGYIVRAFYVFVIAVVLMTVWSYE